MKTSHSAQFEIQFWGVRGSIPSPGQETVRYGGNTSCIEIRVAGKRLIFDGGTGLRMLGKSLIKECPIEAYMFFTHYHWDHIQGVPFFTPAFMRGNKLHIYGAVPPDSDNMEHHFRDRVLHQNSPVPIPPIQADLKFYDIVCGKPFNVDDIEIETAPLNHPNGAMGYRITWQGHSVAYCTDTEHFADKLDENVMYLARNADVLIYDAMYTDAEYHNSKSPKLGWGHSTWEEAVKVAKEVNVKHLAVFHHEPNHSDDLLDQIAEEVKVICPGSFLAKEGLIFKVIK
ncbi:MAG TPA: MBL fold metallo-hydrolase [Allocoleopsis sp.]